jgi:hypothetical protein
VNSLSVARSDTNIISGIDRMASDASTSAAWNRGLHQRRYAGRHPGAGDDADRFSARWGGRAKGSCADLTGVVDAVRRRGPGGYHCA